MSLVRLDTSIASAIIGPRLDLDTQLDQFDCCTWAGTHAELKFGVMRRREARLAR